MPSTNLMLQKCSGLVDTTDITDWENNFLKRVLELTLDGKRPDRLSEPQLVSLERIYNQHFA